MTTLSNAERYRRSLEEAWRKFGQSRLRPPSELRDLLERLDMRIKSGLLDLADPEGILTIEQMGQVRILLQNAMDEFRGEYQAWLYGMIYTSANEAWDAQRGALAMYVGAIGPTVGVLSPTIALDARDAIMSRVAGGLNLSERIWRLDWGTRSLLERDIIASISDGRRASQIARRVTQYLIPGREVPKGVPSSAYSGQPRDVSYNAWRLARTEINHTWHEVRQKSDRALADEGIVLGTRWVLSAVHRERMLKATNGKTARDICDDWAERMPGTEILKGQPPAAKGAELAMLRKLVQYGINPRGVYLPGKAPLDHPNGLCTTASVLLPMEVLKERLDNG